MDQLVPRLYFCSLIHIAIEHIQEGIVGQYVDCHLAYIAQINSQCGVLLMKAYVHRPPLVYSFLASSIRIDDSGRVNAGGSMVEGGGES